MSSVDQQWYTSPSGALVLSMRVVVNGTPMAVSNSLSEESVRFGRTPPVKYLEREMRRQLMRHIEDQLFGPERI